MASEQLYVNFRQALEYWKESTQEWLPTSIAEENDLIWYTLPSSPVRLRVNLDHEIFANYYLSNNYVQWDMGNSVYQNGPEINYQYYVAGEYNLRIYIARSDGKVITMGFTDQETLDITIKNVVETNIQASYGGLQGEGVNEWGKIVEIIYGPDGEQLGTRFVMLSSMIDSGQPSSPINIKTTHTWQLYDETPDPYGVTLYADLAGFRFSEDLQRGNESAPLKTSSYMSNKYAQFQKTWRFTTDPEGVNPVDRIQTSNTKLYARKNIETNSYELCGEFDTGAEFVGTSGTNTVYYIDDSPGYNGFAGGKRLAYRLMFSLDTTGWPGPYSFTSLPTKQMKEDPEYIETPPQMVAPTDSLMVDVRQAAADQIVFTSTGINTHNISKNKFQNTQIPVIMSVANENGSIIKEYEDVKLADWAPRTPFHISDYDNVPMNTYFIGLEFADGPPEGFSSADVTFSLDSNLADIELYSSAAFVLKSREPLYNVRLKGVIKSPAGPITGESNYFDILPETGEYSFFKHGEEIDYGSIINSSILQENISQHDTVRHMFSAIFGGAESLPNAVGKTVNEKIKNFVANNRDVDECNVKSLFGLANEIKYTLQSYDLNFPGSVKRVVDMLSTGINKIIGTRDRYVEDYDTEPIMLSGGRIRYGKNISDQELNTSTYMVTAGVPLVVKEMYGDNRFKVIPSIVAITTATDVPGSMTTSSYNTTTHNADYYGIEGMMVYPLSAYDKSWNWGLTYPEERQEFHDYYQFYDHIDNSAYSLYDYEQNTGLINWEATRNMTSLRSLSDTVTSYDDWYGHDGVIESSLEHSIRIGLDLFDK